MEEFEEFVDSEEFGKNLWTRICGHARICPGILPNTMDSTIRPAQPATGNLGQARS